MTNISKSNDKYAKKSYPNSFNIDLTEYYFRGKPLKAYRFKTSGIEYSAAVSS